jgi:hypothetical protein
VFLKLGVCVFDLCFCMFVYIYCLNVCPCVCVSVCVYLCVKIIAGPNNDLCYFVCISVAQQESGLCTSEIVSVVLYHFGSGNV